MGGNLKEGRNKRKGRFLKREWKRDNEDNAGKEGIRRIVGRAYIMIMEGDKEGKETDWINR